MAKPTLDAQTIEVLSAAPQVQLEQQTTKEQVKKVIAKLDLAETVTRGSGVTDALTCKPTNSGFGLASWVVEWVGNQPQGTYKLVLERTAVQSVTPSGGNEDSFTANNVSKIYTDQITSYEFTNLPAAGSSTPAVAVTTYDKVAVVNNQEVGDWMITSDVQVTDGIVYMSNNKIKWVGASKPPTTKIETLITTLPDGTPTSKSFVKGTDWDIVGGAFTWLIPESQRPLAGELIDEGPSVSFSYDIAYTHLTVLDITRGSGNVDALPTAYSDMLQSTQVVGTKDGKSWNFMSPDDYSVYATAVVPPQGLSQGTTYSFTGTSTSVLPATDFDVQTTGGVSSLLVFKTLSEGSSLIVEYAYSMGPAYS